MKAALFIPVLFLACSCVTAQEPRSADDTEWLGYTECVGQARGRAVARSWINDRFINDPLLPGIRAHEAGHRMTVQMFPNCEKYESWLQSGGLLRAELIAHCIEAQEYVRRGILLDLPTALQTMAEKIAGAYPELETTEAEALALLGAMCKAAQ